ncbi:cytidylate kinase family protein [Planctomycetota bacterium]
MLSIGDLAKATGLTIKTIRLYHEKGLLPPALIDPWTRYRYYDQQSIELARTIIQLRDLDFSLSDIREVLAHRETEVDLLRFLKKQRAAIVEKLRRYSDILFSLDAEIDSRKEALVADSRFTIDRDAGPRVESWLERLRSARDAESASEATNFTISSLCGAAGGESLAVVLGQRTGFCVWDEELIAALAASKKHSDAILSSLDEDQRDAVDLRVRSAMTATAYDKAGATYEQLRLAAAIAAHGGSIIVELGGNYLLSGEQALRVRLEPPLEETVSHYSKRHQLELEVARQQLTDRDKALRTSVRETFGGDLSNPADYDLVLNSSTLHLYGAVELLVRAYESRFQPAPGWWCP